MRNILQRQLPLLPTLPEHSHLNELKEMSKVLDAKPEIAALVHDDLVRGLSAKTGSEGLRGDQVLRAAILYHSNRWSFETLAFELRYHAAYRWFCVLDHDQFPSKSSLHRDIRRIGPETWEAVHRIIIVHAQDLGVEDGKQVRSDCTVVTTNIHEPTDSSLLWDCVRELTRQLKHASKLVSVAYSDHRKRAKRRAWAIRNAKRQKQRVPLYRETHYGHKICLSSGPSNLITDVVVLDGNPRDSTLVVSMMERHEKLFGCPAKQAAFDGGFATQDNLTQLKAMKIDDVMFSKRVGLAISDMVKESWIYKRLRDFRAGIEGVISFLKRAFGLRRCRFRGHSSFKSYVFGSVVSANLLTLARHQLA